MNKRQVTAWIAIIVVATLVGHFNLTVGIAILVAFIVPILTSLGVFKEEETTTKDERKKEVQRQLKEVYSPIHYMIGKLKQHINLGDANGIGFLGGDVALQELENFDQVKQIFIDHGHELREGMIQQWTTNLHIHTRDLQWAGGPGAPIPVLLLYVNKELGDLFRELETNYQKLAAELKSLSIEK